MNVNEHRPYASWHLIQRCSIRDPRFAGDRKGIDKLLSFDYMGSAEFEFGALPKAVRLLREAAVNDKLELVETPFNSVLTKEPFYVIASKDLDKEYLFQGVFGSGSRAYNTKEGTYMDIHLNKDTTRMYGLEICAWMILDGPPVFWSSNKTLAQKVLAELKSVAPVVGVAPEDLRLYDKIRFNHAGHAWTGEVRGIYDLHARVRLDSGTNQNVPYTSIIKKV